MGGRGWIVKGAAVALCVTALQGEQARAQGPMPWEMPQSVKITGYCNQGVTASGSKVRPGICAFRKEDIGRMACVRDEWLNVIGYYEIKDTGSEPVRSGRVIDIWFATEEECAAITQYGYVEVYDAVG